LGYSTGGAIAIHFAHQYPTRVISTILMMTSINLHIKNDAFQGKDTSQEILSPPKSDYINDIKATMQKETKTQQEKIQQYVELFKLSNGHKLDFDESYFYTLFERSQNRLQSLTNKNWKQKQSCVSVICYKNIK
jgi:pimeloyl-ACP methyl ester carboxylesterase